MLPKNGKAKRAASLYKQIREHGSLRLKHKQMICPRMTCDILSSAILHNMSAISFICALANNRRNIVAARWPEGA
ncbi:hypothetical protein A616_12440 [Brevibacillus brevis X23]|nr:hypothetical protein A616_12440 [Brevibacillus brevis X23]